MKGKDFFASPAEKRAWLALLAVAFLLRVIALGARPFHHDESIHAWSASRLVYEGNYKYDPVYHGPVQYYLVGLALRIEGLFADPKAMAPGEGDTAARLPAALGGVALVALALLLRPRFGPAAALVAGALLAVSPTFLYYTRFCREDVWSLLGTAGAFLFLDAFVRTERLRDIALSALFASVAFASKENFYVLVAMMVPAVLVSWAEPGRGLDLWNRLRKLIDFLEKHGFALAGALFLFFNVSILLYTVFLNHPESGNPFFEAISYWWGQHKVERVSGPKTYYLPRILQYEFAIVLPAFALILGRWRSLTAVERFLAGWGVSSLLMYAWLGEKTPWLIVHQVLPFVPLAGKAWAEGWERSRRWRTAGAVSGFVTVWFSLQLSFVYPAITPNVPKAESVIYVQTTPELLDLRDRILAYGRVGEVPAAIVAGEAGWPMSWYLRRAPVNWEMPKGDLHPPIVVCDTNQADKASAALGAGYVREPDLPFRAWWIPETSSKPFAPKPGDLLRYLLTRRVWRGNLPPGANPIGAVYVAVLRRVGPAAPPAPVPAPAAPASTTEAQK
ncbi:MAG: flippase activity-associated protein Agl23 [Acidithiobacillales bacterium]